MLEVGRCRMAKLLNGKMKILNERGFSMLELLIALVILEIGVLMLAGMQFATISANTNGYKMSTAAALGERLMERIKLLAINDPQLIAGTYNGVINVPLGGANYFPATVNGVTFNGQYTVTNDTPVVGLKRIDLTVSWVDNGNHSVVFTGRAAP